MSTPFLSIIIPAHNEEHRLPATLEQVRAFLQTQSYNSEILVMENASQDRTLQIALDFVNSHISDQPLIRVLQVPKRGKGAAVKRGMLEARGEYRFMCDADLSMPIEEVNRFLPPELTGFDIAIASREVAGAMRYNEPAYRHLVGRVFNTLIRKLALPTLQDTQCGFKCFRAAVVDDLFHQQTIPGWSFDVEILYIAHQRGYKILEVPIPWYYNSNSKINVLKDSFQMGLDILKIRLNDLRGGYGSAR